MSLDYDLYVIDSTNHDTSMSQLRDCLKDAIDELAKRTVSLSDRLNELENEAVVADNKAPSEEPLIKDEKIRKAVRAWAEANKIGYHDNIRFDAIEHRLIWVSTAIEFNEFKALSDLEKIDYTIAELCGEEEE